MEMENVPWLNEEEAAAWRGYITMSQLLNAQVERDSWEDSKLSGADYAVLVSLSEDPSHRFRMSDLACHMTWSKSRLSHQVSRMEKRGLVERFTCTEDGRGAWLVLTPRGMGAIQKAAPAHVASVRRHFFAALSPEQVKAMAEIAAAVNAHLQSHISKMDCDSVTDPEIDGDTASGDRLS